MLTIVITHVCILKHLDDRNMQESCKNTPKMFKNLQCELLLEKQILPSWSWPNRHIHSYLSPQFNNESSKNSSIKYTKSRLTGLHFNTICQQNPFIEQKSGTSTFRSENLPS